MGRKGFRQTKQRRLDGRLEREVELLVRIREAAGRARQRLIGELMRVGEWDAQIRAVTRRWRQAGIVPEEMYSTGVQGWLEAVERFDVSKSAGWVGYAHMWIYKRCEELIRRQGAIVVESEWERRQARREGRERRAHGWASLDRVVRAEEVEIEEGVEGRAEGVEGRLQALRRVMAEDVELSAGVAAGEEEALSEARERVLAAERVARELPRLLRVIDAWCEAADRRERERAGRERLWAALEAQEAARAA